MRPGVSKGGQGLESGHTLSLVSTCSTLNLCISSSRSPVDPRGRGNSARPPSRGWEQPPAMEKAAAIPPHDASQIKPKPPPDSCPGASVSMQNLESGDLFSPRRKPALPRGHLRTGV